MKHASFQCKKFQQAQAKSFDFSKCTTLPVKCMVESYAGAVGCPEEYVYLPLLTVCASFVGANTTIKIKETWSEPPIRWTFSGTLRTGSNRFTLTEICGNKYVLYRES